MSVYYALASVFGILIIFILIGYLIRRKEKLTFILILVGGIMTVFGLGLCMFPIGSGMFLIGWPIGFIGCMSDLFLKVEINKLTSRW